MSFILFSNTVLNGFDFVLFFLLSSSSSSCFGVCVNVIGAAETYSLDKFFFSQPIALLNDSTNSRMQTINLDRIQRTEMLETSVREEERNTT